MTDTSVLSSFDCGAIIFCIFLADPDSISDLILLFFSLIIGWGANISSIFCIFFLLSPFKSFENVLSSFITRSKALFKVRRLPQVPDFSSTSPSITDNSVTVFTLPTCEIIPSRGGPGAGFLRSALGTFTFIFFSFLTTTSGTMTTTGAKESNNRFTLLLSFELLIISSSLESSSKRNLTASFSSLSPALSIDKSLIASSTSFALDTVDRCFRLSAKEPVMTRTGGSGGTTATLGILRGGGTILGITVTSTFGFTAVALGLISDTIILEALELGTVLTGFPLIGSELFSASTLTTSEDEDDDNVSISRLTLLRTLELLTSSILSNIPSNNSLKHIESPNPLAGKALIVFSTSLGVLAKRIPDIQSAICFAASNFDIT
mmetsp:Transcript_25874/g.24693  ORF Transcript_25874/g.24693 Transcript_25874/m.24693 type:complete len:377 (-) Transcript_25874:729-1859(-)